MSEQQSSSRSERLNAIFADYQKSVDAGNSPVEEQVIARHPEFADELREFFASKQTGAEIAASESPTIAPTQNMAPASESPTLPPAPPASEADTIPPSSDESSAGSPTTTAVGDSVRYFGDYELLEEIARGGMGVVYKARQVNLNRIVALKMILAGQLASEDDVKRFYTEAEAAANLEHPGIVPIFEVGQHDGQHYFSMGFVEGHDLKQRVSDGPLDPEEAAELVQSIAEALAYAHDKGIIHRDLKPQNILLGQDGKPRVTDFGLAKQIESDSNLTGTGQVMGTPSYMPPEQAAGKTDEIGPLADVYSLGAILYELITGRPPFQSASALDTLMQVIEKDPVAPRILNPEVPRDLETICLKCLQKDRQHRYASADELVDELQRFLNGEPIQARPVSNIERARKWCRRKPVVATLIGAVALSLIIGTTVSTYFAIVANERARVARIEEGRANQNAEKFRIERDRAESEKERANQNAEKFRTERDRAESEKNRADRKAAEAQKLANRERELREKAQRDAAYLLFEQSYTKCVQQDAAIGMLWLSRSLESAVRAEAIELEASIRSQLAAWSRELHPLLRIMPHQDKVTQVVCRPDAAAVLTVSGKTAQLWEVGSGKQIGPPMMHEHGILGAAFSRDSNSIVIVTEEKVLRWQSGTNNVVELRAPRIGRNTVASFDSEIAVAATHFGGNRLYVWDLESGMRKGEMLEHPRIQSDKIDLVSASAISPDGKTLVTGCQDKTARLWEIGTWKASYTLQHEGGVQVVRFSPDGQLILTAANDLARIWSTSTGKQINALRHDSMVATAAFSPDGKTIATGCYDKTTRIWDLQTGKQVGAPLRHEDVVLSVAFDSQGEFVVTASGNNVRLWRLSLSHLTGRFLPHKQPVTYLRLGANKRVVTWGENLPVQIWNIESLTRVGTPLKHEADFNNNAVRFSTDGKTIVTVTPGGEVQLWDATNGKPVGDTIKHGDGIVTIALSSDGKMVATASRDKTARLWDATTGEPIGAPLVHNATVSKIAFNHNGTSVLTVACDKIENVYLWNTKTQKQIRDPLTCAWGIRQIAVHPDGTAIAFGCNDNKARVLDPETWEPVIPNLEHEKTVNNVCFSPDGRYLLTGSWDGKARLWDTETGERVGSFGHNGGVTHVTFCPDGKTILTSSHDKTAQLWDVHTGKQIGTPLHHQGGVSDVAVTPDQKYIFTGAEASGDVGELRRWEFPAGRQAILNLSVRSRDHVRMAEQSA